MAMHLASTLGFPLPSESWTMLLIIALLNMNLECSGITVEGRLISSFLVVLVLTHTFMQNSVKLGLKSPFVKNYPGFICDLT